MATMSAVSKNNQSSPIKPRLRGKRDQNYDEVKEVVRVSKFTPQNVQTTGIINQHSKEQSGPLPSEFPSVDEILSLTSLVEKYSGFFPLHVKVLSGFMAENEGDPTLYVDDVYNIHAMKQSEVVTIVDCRRQKYSLPLHSAAKFGLINSDSAEMYSVYDLCNAPSLPPVIAAMSSYTGSYMEYNFKENEILLPNKVINAAVGGNNTSLIKVFSVSEQKEKYIPIQKECSILFTTRPEYNKLYLSEIIQHASHLLPSRAKLFISQNEAKLPKHLTSKPVTIQPKHTQTSLIISLYKKHSHEKDKVYIDIPVSIDIDIQVLRPETTQPEYISLIKDSNNLVKEFDPTKLQACVNANDDDTYITQAQLLKALRQGYETAGTMIKTSGVENMYEPLTDKRQPVSVYQEMVFPGKKQELCNYEELDFQNDPASLNKPIKPSITPAFPPPVMPRSKPPAIQPTRRSTQPPPLLPKQRTLSSPPDVPIRPQPSVPPKPSTHDHDRTKRPLPAPAFQSRKPLVKKSDTETSPLVREASEQTRTETATHMEMPPLSMAKNVSKEHSTEPKKSAIQAKVESPVLSRKTQPVIASPISDNSTDSEASASLANEDKARKGDQYPSDKALFAINESLRLLLGKVETIEKKQTQFEKELTGLKHQGGSRSEVPLEIGSMTQQDVQNLLDAMDLPHYKESFAKEWVDGEVLKDLDEESLEELGVKSKLHRLKLLKIISGSHPLERYLKFQ